MMTEKEKLDMLRKSIDESVEIILAGEEGYINRALTILSDAREFTKDESGSYMDYIGQDLEEYRRNKAANDARLTEVAIGWRGYRNFLPEILEPHNRYGKDDDTTSTAARKLYFAVMYSTDPEISSLSHEKKLEMINDGCVRLITDEWEASGRRFDLQMVLRHLSSMDENIGSDSLLMRHKLRNQHIHDINESHHSLKDLTSEVGPVGQMMKEWVDGINQDELPDDSGVMVNIVDRSIIENPTFNAFTSEFGPTTPMDKSWNPGLTLLDKYNSLSDDHKSIVNRCCTHIPSDASNVIINLLLDHTSPIHTSDGLFSIGALMGSDIIDDSLYRMLIICNFDFQLIMLIMKDFSHNLFTKEDLIWLSSGESITANPIYLKYEDVFDGGSNGQ